MAGRSSCGFLDVGQRFTDFVDFETKLKRFEEVTFTKYIISNSTTIERANKMIVDPQNWFQKHLKYCRIHYICKHGGKYTPTSSGKRPNQRTFKNNCPSKFTVMGDKKGNCLVIRKSNLTHNHPIDKSKYLSYPQVRKLDEADERLGKALLQMEVPSKVFKETIREVSGKQVTNHDIKNLRSKLRNPKTKTVPVVTQPVEVGMVVKVESMDCESESEAATSVLVQSSMSEDTNVLVQSSIPEEGAVNVTNYDKVMSQPPTTTDVIVKSFIPEGAVQVTNYETVISQPPTTTTDVIVQSCIPEGAVQVTNYETITSQPPTTTDVIVQSCMPEGAVQVTNYETVISQPLTTTTDVVQSSMSEGTVKEINYETIMSGPPTTPAQVVLIETDSNVTTSTNDKTDTSSSCGILDVGQTFTDFVDFETKLKHFEEDTFTKYIISNSTTIERANKMIVDPQNWYQKHLKYRRIHYSCKHAGEYKTTSSGKRPNQRSFKNNCPAKFTVVGDRKENCLVINKSNLTHNHPIEKSGYLKYPQVRKLDKEHELSVPSKVLKKTTRQASSKKQVNPENLSFKLRSGKQGTSQVRQPKEESLVVMVETMDCESEPAAATPLLLQGSLCEDGNVLVLRSMPEGAVQVMNCDTVISQPSTTIDVVVQNSVNEGAVQVSNSNTMSQPSMTATDVIVQGSLSKLSMKLRSCDTIMSGPPTTPARVVLLQSPLPEKAEKVTNNDIAENKPQTDASSSCGILDVGQTFTDFVDFETKLKRFEEVTFTKYIISNSTTIERANKIIVDPQNWYKKDLKYIRVHYICKHGGKYRTTSSGIRPNQRSFKNNCPAKFTVVGDRKENCLVINKSNLTHNHPIEKSGYLKYPQVRKLDKEHELSVPSKVLKKTTRKASGKKLMNQQNLSFKLRSGKQGTSQVRQVGRPKEESLAVPFGSMDSDSNSAPDYDIIESEPPTAATDAVLVQSSPMPKDAVKVKGYDFNQGIDHHQLLNSFRYSGFQATNLGLAVEEINKMIECKKQPLPDTVCEINLNPIERERTNCTIFLGYTSNMISAGVRDSIRFLVQHNMVDCIVTSAGGIEEDFIKCLAPTYLGKFELDGRELRKKGINRIGNLVVPNDNYIKFEEFLMPILDKMLEEQQNDSTLWTPSRMIHRLGKEIDDPDSVYYWAYKNNIPVFSPALTDGSIGDMLYVHSHKKPGLVLDIIKDIHLINSQAVYAQNTGMIILGGGLIKHHICNANLMRNGANFSVYVNTANEFDGSDSGARPDEAISWGKIRMDATPVKVYGEASIIFPLLVAETFAREFHLSQSERRNTKQE